MSSAKCTNLKYKYNNGGWSDWNTSLTGGYAGPDVNRDHIVVLQFKTPAIDGLFTNTKLNITIPYVRQDNKTTGTLYMKLYTSDPSTKAIDKLTLTADTCDATATWEATDREVHTTKCTITKDSLKADTTYYIVIDASSYMQIGYSGYKDRYSIELEYTTYTNGSAPTVIVKDNKNNTTTISGAVGINGKNNELVSTNLYYTTDGSDPSSSDTRSKVSLTKTSGASYTTNIDIVRKCTVRAYVECKFEHNTTSAASSSVSIIYYVAPNVPGVPVLSYTKSRLTTKEPWTWKWTAATAGNSDSPIKGYYIMLLRKAAGKSDFEYVREIAASTSDNYLSIVPGSNSNNDSNYYVRRESTSCTAILQNPAAFGFAPGDEVKLRVKSFTKNGANNVIQSEGAADSSNYLIQNAGVVHTKVGGSWKEGQVYVKVNGSWLEAETVNVKAGGSWHESE